jgi:hypothetical protein
MGSDRNEGLIEQMAAQERTKEARCPLAGMLFAEPD